MPLRSGVSRKKLLEKVLSCSPSTVSGLPGSPVGEGEVPLVGVDQVGRVLHRAFLADSLVRPPVSLRVWTASSSVRFLVASVRCLVVGVSVTGGLVFRLAAARLFAGRLLESSPPDFPDCRAGSWSCRSRCSRSRASRSRGSRSRCSRSQCSRSQCSRSQLSALGVGALEVRALGVSAFFGYIAHLSLIPLGVGALGVSALGVGARALGVLATSACLARRRLR